MSAKSKKSSTESKKKEKRLVKKSQAKKARAKKVSKRPSFAHKGLDEAIQGAKDTRGYMITVTQFHHEDEGGLTHSTFTHNFLRGDIFPSLEEVAKLLEVEARIPDESKSNKKK